MPTVEELYENVLGREAAADPKGFEFWSSYQGDLLPAFLAAAQAERPGAIYTAPSLSDVGTAGLSLPPPDRGPIYPEKSGALPDYSGLVSKAYTDVLGRSAAEDVAGSKYWTGELASGRISPDQFQSYFSAAAAPELAIQNLYKDVLNRPADITGLQHYMREFGPEVSPEERQLFIEMAQPELRSRMTDVEGKTYDTETVRRLVDQIIPNIESLQGGIYGTKGESVGFSYDEAKRVLGVDPKPGDQVVLDMARNLINQGITDLNQLNVKDVLKDIRVSRPSDESGVGDYYISIPTGKSDGEGGPISVGRRLTDEEIKRIEEREVTDPEGNQYVEQFIRGVPSGKGLYAAEKLIYDAGGTEADILYHLGQTYSGPGVTSYQITIDPVTGKPEFSTRGSDTGEGHLLNMALTVASFHPATAMWARGASALLAASKGDTLGALTSLSGMGGAEFANVTTGLQVVNSLKNDNPLGAVNALMSNPNISAGISDVKLDGNITIKDVSNAANLAISLSKNDTAGVMNAAANLIGSDDLKTASAAVRVIDAVQSGNTTNLVNAVTNLDRTIAASNNITNKDVTINLANSAINQTVTDAGQGSLWDATHKSSVDSGMPEDQATNNANLMTSVQESVNNPATVSSTATTEVSGQPTTVEGVVETGDDQFKGFDQAKKDALTRSTIDIKNAEADSLEEAIALAGARGFTSFNYDGKNYNMTVENATVAKQVADAEIAAQENFSNAYSTARSILGPGQTFEWGGKTYSTDTREENPILAAASDKARATPVSQQDLQSSYNTELETRQEEANKAAESTGFWQNFSNWLTNQMKLSSEAANDYLKNNPNSPITNNVSIALEAAGELQKNVAGGLATLANNKPLADAFIKGGEEMIKAGQAIGTGPQDSQNWKTTQSLMDAAPTWTEKVGVLFGRILDGNSGLSRQVQVELRQELPALAIGGGSVKGILIASGAIDTADTAGNAAIEAYDSSIKDGKNHNEALADARKAGAAAGATEAVIQLTLGKIVDVSVGKFDNLVTKGVGRTTGETVTEGAQEGVASLAVDLALGQEANINKAITSSIIGGAVGKGTSVATSPITTAQDAQNVSDTASIASTNTNNTIASGADTKIAVEQGITSAMESGGDQVGAVTGSVSSAILSGGETMTVTSSAVTSAINNGMDPSEAATVTVTSAIFSGADPNLTINSAINSATINGGDVQTTVEAVKAATSTIGTNVTVESTTNQDNTIATTTTTNQDTNVQTTTVTDTNTNTTTNTTTDNNTNITTNSVTNNSTGETVTTTTNNTTGETVTTTSTTEPVSTTTETPPVSPPPSTPPPSDPPPTTPSTKTEPTKTPTKREPILFGGLPFGFVPTIDEISKLTFKDPFISSRLGQERFRGPLEEFFQEVEGMPESPSIQQVLEQKLQAEKEAMPDYFTYGRPTEIEDFFGLAGPPQPTYPMMAAHGGLATPLMARGGLPMVAHSGKARVDFREGAAVTGPGDGQSDDIPAMLADGEFVFPADVVAALGNGSTKAGSEKLYEMMHSIREHHRSAKPRDLPPPAKKNPLDYLKKSRR